jgi:hypothetical protein
MRLTDPRSSIPAEPPIDGGIAHHSWVRAFPGSGTVPMSPPVDATVGAALAVCSE